MSIKDLRTKTKMTQCEFAEYFGISVRTLQEWEQGRKRPPTYLENLLLRILDDECFGKKEKINGR